MANSIRWENNRNADGNVSFVTIHSYLDMRPCPAGKENGDRPIAKPLQ